MLGWIDRRPLGLLVSPDRARTLSGKPGLKTVYDLLTNYPRNYARMGDPTAMEPMEPGEMYTCVAEILHAQERENYSGRGPRRYITFSFSDGVVRLDSALFGNPAMHRSVLVPGSIVLLYGKLDIFNDRWQLKNPSYVSMFPADGARFGAYGPLKTIVDITGSEAEAQKILNRPWLPFYGRRSGTTTAELTGVVNQVLGQLDPIPEVLPTGEDAPAWPADPEGEQMIPLDTALRQIHQPPAEGPHAALFRLKFNEALSLQLVMALRRADATVRSGFAMAVSEDSDSARASMLAHLPYTLSPGQEHAVETISAALHSETPANLMLQGDVGAGKTIVALLAMLQAVDAGYQCAFIAPTEVLAAQHARTLVELLGLSPEGSRVGVTLLTGSQKTSERKAALLDIVSGQADIVVGTHALIQDTVEFFNLGLVVVDEQHRFGVRQRDFLRERSPADATPHMLVMTATPIPRTVAMTMFGDLEPVRLEGLPQGRGEVSTVVVPLGNPAWFRRIWTRMAEEAAVGHQAFVVVPKIEGEDGVEAWAERIRTTFAPQLQVGMVHGRMPAEDKDEIMQAFAAGEYDVLVATTVIEVGVDIPNATMMVVVDAENFGVSQLHQLRGRVGRGAADAVCLLVTGMEETSASYQRLIAVADTHDGFDLAELDLKQRTEGDVLGQRQSGSTARRVDLLDLSEDGEIIEAARDYAQELVAWDAERARELVADIEIEDQEYIERA
ncbi:DEAD/DEAH box helicase [Corynebacterium sp. zg254]|uniref:ATP-dependent DNA helicase RecG n=1 Tax=Corynebacterium zhongnanshanii TaxID=2768834 RepID=A0ABQ6VFV8_9CORY|nr:MULTISPECIES: ATP-dependent DNA helicase RecG [Corynebacterium]KAB3523302.1 ATP-dependent DNA helicase RecG [Corynebacterium zhongnanshanii]MCR5913577.1 DEAD/DEAH box helicase [Corynebacterium sp. zg254]